MSRRYVWGWVQQFNTESAGGKIRRRADRRKSQRTPSAAAQSCEMGALQEAAANRACPRCLRLVLGSIHGFRPRDEPFPDVVPEPMRIRVGSGEHRGLPTQRGRRDARMDELTRASRQHPQSAPSFCGIRNGEGCLGAAVLDCRFRRMKSGSCRTQRQPIQIGQCLP